ALGVLKAGDETSSQEKIMALGTLADLVENIDNANVMGPMEAYPIVMQCAVSPDADMACAALLVLANAVQDNARGLEQAVSNGILGPFLTAVAGGVGQPTTPINVLNASLRLVSAMVRVTQAMPHVISSSDSPVLSIIRAATVRRPIHPTLHRRLCFMLSLFPVLCDERTRKIVFTKGNRLKFRSLVSDILDTDTQTEGDVDLIEKATALSTVLDNGGRVPMSPEERARQTIEEAKAPKALL
ncbi:hypothetical protein KIPB_002315, partial [Kipferlia bialata]